MFIDIIKPKKYTIQTLFCFVLFCIVLYVYWMCIGCVLDVNIINLNEFFAQHDVNDFYMCISRARIRTEIQRKTYKEKTYKVFI